MITNIFIVRAEAIARSFDENFELVSFQRANNSESSIIVMNVANHAVIKEEGVIKGPTVLIKGVNTESKFERSLRSDNFIKAKDATVFSNGSKRALLVVGESIGDVHACEGSKTIASGLDPLKKGSYFAEIMLNGPICIANSGSIVPSGQSDVGCEVHSPKSTGFSFEEGSGGKNEGVVVAALTSHCSSNAQLNRVDIGVIAEIATSNRQEVADEPKRAKVLLKAEAIPIFSLDTFSSNGPDIWFGGIAESSCTSTTNSPCQIVAYVAAAPPSTIPVASKGVWVAHAKISEGALDVISVHFFNTTATQLLPFVFSNDAVHIIIKDKSTLKQTTLSPSSSTPSTASTSFSSVALENQASVPKNTILHATIIKLDADLAFTLPPTSSTATTKYLLSMTQVSSLLESGSISSFYALLPSSPSSPSPSLKPHLLSYAFQESPSDVTLIALNTFGGNESIQSPSIPKPITSLITSSFVSLPVAKQANLTVASIASSIEPNGLIPFQTIFVTSLIAGLAAPHTPNAPVAPLPPPVAPLPVTISPILPPSSSPSPSPPPLSPIPPTLPPKHTSIPTPLYVSNEMSNTTKWAIFAIALIVLAGIGYLGYRFYYAKYIAPQLNRQERLPSSLELVP